MVDAVQYSVFTNPFVLYIVMPFLLVFVLIFSVLEKANILGEGKRAANAIVAAVMAFIFVGVPSIVGVAIKMIPWVSLILVTILCALMVFGFMGMDIPKGKGWKITFGILFGLALLAVVLWAAGVFSLIHFTTTFIQYLVLFLIFGGALALIVATAPTRPNGAASS
jgi:hypothetical protein